MDDLATSYVASLLGFGKPVIREEPKPKPTMSKVAAVTILKAKESSGANILVFAKDAESVFEEIRSFFGRGVQRYTKGKDFCQLHFLQGGIFVMSQSIKSDRLCGVRGNILVVEGSEKEVGGQFIYEVALPFMSICFDPMVKHKLEELCGESLTPFSRKNEIVYTDGVINNNT